MPLDDPDFPSSRRGHVRSMARCEIAGNRPGRDRSLELPSADYAVERVHRRFLAGGHAVPEADVRRRFHRGMGLVTRPYKPAVDEWCHWYSDDGGLRLVDYRSS